MREAIYSALFNKVSGAAGFITASRRLQMWTELSANQQPALFQAQKGETVNQQKGKPPKYTLSVEIYIYAKSDDPNVPPSSILNPLIDAVEASITPDPVTGVQNLGVGGVSHCWIEGKIETDEGVLGDQAIAIIPVSILTT